MQNGSGGTWPRLGVQRGEPVSSLLHCHPDSVLDLRGLLELVPWAFPSLESSAVEKKHKQNATVEGGATCWSGHFEGQERGVCGGGYLGCSSRK